MNPAIPIALDHSHTDVGSRILTITKIQQRLESLIARKEEGTTKDDVLPCEEAGPVCVPGETREETEDGA